MMSKARYLILALSMLAVASTICTAEVPSVISYQGKLLQPSGVPVPDGTYSVQFAIYSVATGGAALWTETNSSVQVKTGLFSVLLGTISAFPDNIFSGPDRWFGVKIGTDPETSPRQKVTSVAYAQTAGNGVPAGTLAAFAGSSAPGGWLLCNGQAVSRSTYANLFAAIGTTYGSGDGSTTFNIPDLRGRVMLGTSASHSLASTGGSENKNISHTHTTGDCTLTTTQIPAHSHGVTDPGHRHPTRHRANLNFTGSGLNPLVQDANSSVETNCVQSATTGISINNAGGGGAHNHGSTGSGGSTTQEIMMPFISVNHIIKT